jgi:hypothetical protein
MLSACKPCGSSTGDLDREAYYVKAALEAAADRSLSYETDGIGAGAVATQSAEQLAAHPAILVLSTRGLDRRGRELLAAYAQAGGGLLIAVGPDVDAEVAGELLVGSGTTLQITTTSGTKPDKRAFAPTDVRHPIFQRFAADTAALGLVEFRQVANIGGGGCGQLARFTTGEAALVDCAAGQGRVLVLTSDLDNRWNDFPLRATFVPFLHEAVAYLASSHSHADEYTIGDAAAGGLQHPGIVQMPETTAAAGSLPRRVAVNVDPRESEPARMTAEDFQGSVAHVKDERTPEPRLAGADREDRQHLWRYLLALMLAVLVVEELVASRTA